MDGSRGRDSPGNQAGCRGDRFGAPSPASDQPPISSEMACPDGSPFFDYSQIRSAADDGTNLSPAAVGSRHFAVYSRPSEVCIPERGSAVFRGEVHIELRPDNGQRRRFLLNLLFGHEPPGDFTPSTDAREP